jgi:cytochrome c oxidase subunit 3
MQTSTDPGPLAHHYDNIGQMQASARLGIWLFLVTEVMFFGAAFVAYTAYRIWYPEAFLAASSKLLLGFAAINSILLVTSSLTITLAIHAAHEGNQAGLRRYLLITVALALVFLGLKAQEYYIDYKEHLIPGPLFHTAVDPNSNNEHERHSPAEQFKEKGIDPGQVQLFLLFYYCMTGIHVLHMIVGVGLILWLYLLARYDYFRYKERFVYVEVTSLYWHFVDMMWFFLVAILYAAGHHGSLFPTH